MTQVTYLDVINAKTNAEKQAVIEQLILNDVPHVNPFLYATDSYKVSHIRFETNGVDEIYSNFTPRFDKYLAEQLGEGYDKKYVVYGIQWMLLRLHMMAKTGFFDRPKDVVIAEMKRVHTPYIGNENFEHFEKLHDLGYLPIQVKTLDEGTIAPVGVPFLTIRNTLPEFEWLPNFLETIFSTDLWKQMTVATIARMFRQISNEFAIKTTGSTAGTEWQNHDFHVRGASGFESAAVNGTAFLLSSSGTDNLPSLWAAEKFYFSTNGEGLLAGSVSAGEHSVTTLGILTTQERVEVRAKALANNQDADVAEKTAVVDKLTQVAKEKGTIDLVEAEYLYKHWLLTERFKTGIVSDVADSFDYWSHVAVNVLKLKDVIMARDGKYVVRGDSGNPVDVITGLENVDIVDAVARKFMEEAEVGKTFSVKDTKFYVVSKPEMLLPNKYLPISELVRNNFIRVWDANAVAVAQHNVDQLNAAIDRTLKSTANQEDKDVYLNDLNAALEHSLSILNCEHVVVAAEAKGTIEVLWEIFGGTVTEQGYKLLDSHIGMIYGDGITVQRSRQILERLEKKGFASLNIVYGVGSYSLNMISRDHLGMAIKATNTLVDVEGVMTDKAIYKEPKTDSSKKSARGLIQVYKTLDDKGEDSLAYVDMQTRAQEEMGMLTNTYVDGKFEKITTLFEIKEKMWS